MTSSSPEFPDVLPESLAFLSQEEGGEDRQPSWQVSLPPLLDEEGKPVKAPQPSSSPLSPSAALSSEEVDFQCRIYEAIAFYRDWGHRLADLDPLALQPQLLPAGCALPEFTLQELDKPVLVSGWWKEKPLGTVLAQLRHIYCGTLALESTHLEAGEAQNWLRRVFEQGDSDIPPLASSQKEALLTSLIAAEGFEKFLATKFPGAKRFGVEGADSFVPALCLMLLQAETHLGIQQTVIGMAHRGRLNVMAHVLDVPFEWFFAHFQGVHPKHGEGQGSGDVKYHLGAQTAKRILLPNPSHLESVNPVVLGWTRGWQEQQRDQESQAILSLLIHGDAAFMGQGVVAECLGLSQLKGYQTAGTLHVILNNQVGFTANPSETRSSLYASDLAKGFGIPVLHVNGDDMEAVFRAFWISCLFRQKFGMDIVVDLVSYRRFGHNEVDEPTFTQPLMYEVIHKHPSLLTLYSQQLVSEGVTTPDQVQELQEAYRTRLQEAFQKTSTDAEGELQPKILHHPSVPSAAPSLPTGISPQTVETIGQALVQVPESFALHPKLTRFLETRLKMTKGELPFDWASAEAMAFGALLLEGTGIRLSGQDVARGTFTQRHSVWIDQHTQAPYIPLNSLSSLEEASFVNSPLSEMGVMGFELGYSLVRPKVLVLWEAQFGDFVNGAQIIIDQYLAAGEAKWDQHTSLVLLLPHGYEGQGPEHSSARLERFLQLAAQDNLRVASCSTPANYFHILRRQVKSQARKPLILMTPKSLLRHKLAVSSREEIGLDTMFQPVLEETHVQPQRVNRLVLCSGKVYYDLLTKRTELNLQVPLIRLEELYPFPEEELLAVLRPWVSPETTLVWAQEEPYNQGAWFFVEPRLSSLARTLPFKEVIYAGRKEAASTATGYGSVHLQEQEALVQTALGLTAS